MASANLFHFNKKINYNQTINLIFNANHFENNIISFNLFVKKLCTKINIDIDRLIIIYSKIINNNKINLYENPAKIYIEMNAILKQFNKSCKKSKIEKLRKIFEYMIINHHYFSNSQYILNNLKRKLARLLLFTNNDEFEYYIFILVNIKKIELINENIEYFPDLNLDNLDDIDFFLDNLDSTSELFDDILY
jgi:hypothetical protein